MKLHSQSTATDGPSEHGWEDLGLYFRKTLVSLNLFCDRYTYGKPVPGHAKIQICYKYKEHIKNKETGCKEVRSRVSKSVQRPVFNIQG